MSPPDDNLLNTLICERTPLYVVYGLVGVCHRGAAAGVFRDRAALINAGVIGVVTVIIVLILGLVAFLLLNKELIINLPLFYLLLIPTS